MVAVLTFLACIIADYSTTAQSVTLEPKSVSTLLNEEITFTCVSSVQTNWRSTGFDMQFDKPTNLMTFIKYNNSCFTNNRNGTLYDGNCDLTRGQFELTIKRIDERFNNKSISCIIKYGNGTANDPKITKQSNITILAPVTNLIITAVNHNNISSVISGKQQSFNCTTDSIRPAAWIQWYIDRRNVTNHAIISSVPDVSDNTKFISTSTLLYTGDDTDHDRVVYCEAFNIEGREKVKSAGITIFIIFPVTTIQMNPVGVNGEVSVTLEANITFTCRTDSGRPAALIQWYIGEQNVTNLANTVKVPNESDSTKFISISTLVYLGNDGDHYKQIKCKAVNSMAGQEFKSDMKNIFIIVPVPRVTFAPFDVRVEEFKPQTFTCKTDPCRPAAWIQWYISGQNVSNQANLSTTQSSTDNTKFISISTLVYTGNDGDHDKHIHCEAINTEQGHKVKTDNKTLYIVVSITEVTIATGLDNNVVTVETDKTQIFTCVTDSGRPAAWIEWFIGEKKLINEASVSQTLDGSKFVSNSTLIYTADNADHNKVAYCKAGNVDGGVTFRSDNKTLYIIVPIAYMSMLPPVINNHVTVITGERKNFTCKTAPSRPAAWIHWYIRGQNVTNQAILETQANGTQYISSSTLTYIGKIRDHYHDISCDASNIHENNRNISVKKSLSIYSSPTTEGNEPLQENIFVGTDERINISITIIANPSPEVKLTFSNATVPGFDISRTYFNITSADVFRHIILYEKDKPSQTDFGNYTIEASNIIEPKFVHTFVVLPAQVPSEPLHVEAECDQFLPWINVSWKSNFDGGKPQLFSVFFINAFTTSTVKSQYIRDKGQHSIHFHTKRLDYETNYIICVEAKNEFGGVNSSERVNCTTSPILSEEEELSSDVIGGAAGSTAAAFAISIVAIILFLRRHSRTRGDDKQHLNRLTEIDTKQDEKDEDGLKDNPLYVTSETCSDTDVYSPVGKSAQKIKESTVKPSNKMQKQKKKNGNKKTGIELDVYENSDDFRKVFDKNIHGNVNNGSITPGSGHKIKRNKDGLIYADLELPPPESGKPFFIIGSDNRTNYAMIDLTMTADPLPDDSDEDVNKNSE